MTRLALAFTAALLLAGPAAAEIAVLPGTQPLAAQADLSAAMVAGIDRMALGLIEQSKTSRKPTREKLAAAIGLVLQHAAYPEYEVSRFSQRLLVDCDAERAAGFWAGLPLEAAAYEPHVARHRERLWNEIIGRLPDPSLPINPRSRLVRETEKVAIYEIVLDVWDDVFAWGWLCVPKDLAAGERRPVVVCQHGLEGLPEDTVDTDPPIPGSMHAGEYEIWEWNLGRTFNYGELAALVAPRPFMVERGHDDGCGTDEMVNQEYAKVRRLYNKLGLGGRTTIEHFAGPHTIHGEGMVRFLEEKLGWE